MFPFDPDFFWGVIPSLGTLVWIALFVVLVWALVHWLTTRNASIIGYHPTPPPYQLSAGEILRQRYARGEIDDVTFQQMRDQLETSTLPGHQQHF